MSRSIPFGVGLLLISSLASPNAGAEPPAAKATPLYVLAVWTEEADDQADALTAALRYRARQAPGWSLLETNQSFETLAIALKCPPTPDPGCLLRIGDQLNADQYVWGTLEKKTAVSGVVSAELHLWSRSKPQIDAREEFPAIVDPNDPSLRAVATHFFAQLGQTGASIAPVAIAQPTTARVSDQAAAPSSARGQPFPVRTVLAYSAIAVGAGLLVAGAFEAGSWIADGNASADDRRLVPASVTDVCSADPLGPGGLAAMDSCNKSKDAVSASALAWIFAGVGAALAGTGIWLVATERGALQATHGGDASRTTRTRFVLSPSLEPRAGRIDLQATF